MKTLYRHAKVYTGTPGAPFAGCFVVTDGRFTFVGREDDPEADLSRCDETVDLGGSFVCAGFNDSHMHLYDYGVSLCDAWLADHTDSLSGMLDYLRAYVRERDPAPGEWIVGRGWNQDLFTDERRFPSRWDLDTVSRDNPIMISRVCEHCMVINSAAVELLGLTADTPSPEGGRIGLENGVPDGRLYDNAMNLALSRAPLPTPAQIRRCISLACASLNAFGVTSAQTDDYCVFRALPPSVINDVYRDMAADGSLTVRICEQANFTDTEALSAFLATGERTGRGDDMFRMGPVKLFGDGSLGARTAYLSRPYADDPSTRGIPVFPAAQMEEMVDLSIRNGMQVAVHAIGDACLDVLLDAYGKAFAKYRPADHRCGVVHCQITRPDQLERIAALGLHVYCQSIFLDYDIHIIRDRVGDGLAASSYAWKTLKDMGARVSNGTDCPVELPDALAGIQCAVTRRTLDGLGPYRPEEAFSVAEAIDSYTSAGAYASFEENVKGRITGGMLADFVILGGDPFACAPEDIRRIPVLSTFLGGRCVYENPLTRKEN